MAYVSNGQFVQLSNNYLQVWPSMQQSCKCQYQVATESNHDRQFSKQSILL